jgi:hypothetical protein
MPFVGTFLLRLYLHSFDLTTFYIIDSNEEKKSIYKIIIRNSNKKKKKKKNKNEIFYAKTRMSFFFFEKIKSKKMPRDFLYRKGFLKLMYTNQPIEEKRNNNIQLSLEDQLDR